MSLFVCRVWQKLVGCASREKHEASNKIATLIRTLAEKIGKKIRKKREIKC